LPPLGRICLLSARRVLQNSECHRTRRAHPEGPATGDGGTCNGDSGGPNFFGAGSTETTVIAAVTSTGDILCKATNVDYRLDIPEAQSFLEQFLALP
jgi:hypothetical protein